MTNASTALSQWYTVSAGTTATAITNCYWSTGSSTITIGTDPWGPPDSLAIRGGRVTIPDRRALVIELPDGGCIALDDRGNYRIEDEKATVIYRANRMREFNPYVNASDLLAKFIEYLGTLNLRRGDVGKLPLALFINWLVIEAARQDDDPVPSDIVEPERHPLLLERVRPRCLYAHCRRFISRRASDVGFLFCNPAHASAQYALIPTST